jgi:putative membrane protein
VLLIALPALTAAFVSSMKRELRMRRMLFLALINSLVYAAFYAAYGALGDFNLLLAGNALIFGLGFFVTASVFNWRLKAVLFSFLNPLLNVAVFFAGRPVAVLDEPSLALVKLAFASAIFLFAVFAVFWVINAPMKRNFGVSAVGAASLFLAQWLERSTELEGLLDSIGEKADVLVGVLAFKGKQSLKCAFVVPNIHYGPFGTLGGSEFPYLISSEVRRRFGCEAFVLHGAATHDFNPVVASEVSKVNACVAGALQRMRFENARGAFLFGRSAECKAKCLLVNDNALVLLTRAPKCTEDIDFSLGLALRSEAMRFADNAVIADAHNSGEEFESVEAGNPIGFRYLDAIDAAFAKKSKQKPLRLGIATDSMTAFGAKQGFGRNGMQVAVFRIGSKQYALLILDGNSILPSLRKRLIDAVKSTGIDACEVLTTDTHSVNVISGVINPIGKAVHAEALVELAKRKALEAMRNAEPVSAAMRVERLQGISVFGAKHATELISTVNSIIAIARVFAPAVLVLSLLAALAGLAMIK